MIRLLICAGVLAAGSAVAETKEESCALQAKVVASVQQARLDRVRERKVQDAVLATQPDWPEKYNRVIPLVTPWVYEMKMRDVKKHDLSAAWNELCLQQ